MSRPWHFIVGEYPPQSGGVADYAAQVARGLARQGADVHVWAPPSPRGEGGEPGVHVHRLPDRFGPRGLRALGEGLSRPPEGRLFVHYVPQSFGLRGMNLVLPLWLAARREDVWVMFHEVSVEWSREQLAANVLAAATQTMAAVMVRRADRLFVSIPAWSDRLPLRLLRRGVPPPVWLPIPSNLPTPTPTPARAPRAAPGRVVIGHFGTYGTLIAAQLRAVLPRLLEGHPGRHLRLLGRKGDAFARELLAAHPSLAGRVEAPGEQPPEGVGAALGACDVLLQPFPDGISTRRTSAMAGLAQGLPMASNLGPLSEPYWREHPVVALAEDPSADALVRATEALLSSPDRWHALGTAAREAYERDFSFDRTLSVLTSLAAEDDARAGT